MDGLGNRRNVFYPLLTKELCWQFTHKQMYYKDRPDNRQIDRQIKRIFERQKEKKKQRQKD